MSVTTEESNENQENLLNDYSSCDETKGGGH